MKLFSGTPLSQFADQAGRTEPEAVPAKPKAPRARKAASAVVPAEPQHETPLRIVQIPRLAAGGRWRVEAMRSVSEPMLLWFTRGQGRITVGGTTRGYGAHNAIFIPAGVMHGFEVGAQTFGTAIFFGRGCPVPLPDKTVHLRIRESAPQLELSGIIDNIQRELDSSRAGHDRAAQFHLGLLSVWLERQIEIAEAEAKKPDAARRLAARYTELLEREFRSGRGVADFAEELGVTPTHLTRVCNQTCGRSASDILHDRLIFEARKLLSETDLPVRDVSDALGFTSAAYFTRAFQHRTGKTPTAFRRKG